MTYSREIFGETVFIRAWTGGDLPSKEYRHNPANKRFRTLRSILFREQCLECGGLNLWSCVGTSAIERARIFWNRATLDAWRSLNGN
jgi:hypothetical protein